MLLKDMLTQSFEIFEKFGKQPEEIKTAVKTFDMVLNPYRTEDIAKAFVSWLDTGKKMPLPSDIRTLTLAKRKAREFREEATTQAKPSHAYMGQNQAVQWSQKLWGQFTDHDKQEFTKHVRAMKPEEAQNYRLYMQTMCGMPRSVFETKE